MSLPPPPQPSDASDCGSAACAIDLLPQVPKHEHAHEHGDHEHHHHDHGHDHHHHSHEHSSAGLAPPTVQALPPGVALYHIPAMDCAAEEAEIRQALAGITAIASLRFELGARTLAVQAPEAAQAQIEAGIRQAGFAAKRVQATPQASAWQRWAWPRMALALALALLAEVLHFAYEGRSSAALYAGMGLAVLAIALAGWGTYQKGLLALRHFKLNINALMTVAVTGAVLIGQWPEAAMVMALYAIAEAIEAKAVDRARHAIGQLLALAPEQAEVQQADGGWHWQAVERVPVGALLRVKPGARLPLDGRIEQGHSALDQSSLTGESLPIDKTVGDAVFAGSINQTGELQVRVTAVAAESSLARMIHAVEQAQGSRAPTQRFVDRFASIYTPVVFVLALLVALLLPLLGMATWLAAIYKALVLLVIACPCALVISTPVSVVSALARAARQGILMKGGVYLEQARNIRAIALDKTGTLTEGCPVLQKHALLDANAQPAQVLAWAYSLAQRSDHPVSQAIAQGLAAQVGGQNHAVEGFTALLGRGSQGDVAGQRLYLGNERLLLELGLATPELQAQLQALEAQGMSLSLLATDRRALAYFAVADRIKDSSRQAVAELHQLGIATIMLTGDNSATAQAIAAQAGIADARGQLLPEDKLAAIQTLQAEHGVVAMTGDGINDAPALAQADIGFGMGAAGSDIATEAADILIMNDDLRRIPAAIRLSAQTHRILWQNIALAIGIKIIFLILAIFGHATMWMAVFADMGASLLVVFNGLRLLRARV